MYSQKELESYVKESFLSINNELKEVFTVQEQSFVIEGLIARFATILSAIKKQV